MVAAGSYLAVLRARRGLTQDDVASQLNVSTKSIQLWEGGKKVPSSMSLAALTQLVGGVPEDIHALLLDDAANADTGRKLAQVRLGEIDSVDAELEGIASAATPEQLRRALNLLREEYERRPAILERFQGWIEGVRSRDEDRSRSS